MEKNELRIGNYVRDMHSSNSFFGKVKALNATRCFYGDFNCGYNDLRPIPLTPEILGNCGFRKDGLTYKSKITLKQFFGENGKHFLFGYENANIDIFYLHQLQNLYFALTGEELTFKP